MNILIVEDDLKIASYLQKGFKEESFDVEIANNGIDGLSCVRNNKYDIIILDWMLPGLSGVDICTIARKNDILTPILILSAKSNIQDRVTGLNCGADDYLPKPFSFDELLARVNALLRRNKMHKSTILRVSNLTFDLIDKKVQRGDRDIELTSKEYDLLEILMKNKGHVVSNKKISSFLWKNETTSSNIIMVLIHHLRSKVDDGFEKKLIKTVRKIGYKIDED
jgi:DNA-binding response OmpR family regulator